jgi:hypothetical protein
MEMHRHSPDAIVAGSTSVKAFPQLVASDPSVGRTFRFRVAYRQDDFAISECSVNNPDFILMEIVGLINGREEVLAQIRNRDLWPDNNCDGDAYRPPIGRDFTLPGQPGQRFEFRVRGHVSRWNTEPPREYRVFLRTGNARCVNLDFGGEAFYGQYDVPDKPGVSQIPINQSFFLTCS